MKHVTGMPHSASSAGSAQDLRVFRRTAGCAWIACLLATGLAGVQHRVAVLHPWSFTLITLLAATFVIGLLPFFFPALWRLLRGSLRGLALAWIAIGLVPAALWVAVGWHGAHSWSQRKIPGGWSGVLVRMAGASLADAHARWVYPHRLEGQRLIMFYDDRVSDPQGDLRRMEDHLARMEGLTQLRLREKVHWIRGAFCGHHFAMYGLALGSSQSPAGELDSHELAHAFLNQYVRPNAGPPVFLAEGWAEAQSKNSSALAKRLLAWRGFFSAWDPHWSTMAAPEKEKLAQKMPDPEGLKALLDVSPRSYLRELTNPYWSTHNAGAAYWFGGAFADFFIRRYGISRFLELYSNAASRGFEAECRRLCGMDLPTLESELWKDIERIAHATP